MAKPFAKSVGGKTGILPELRKHVPEKFLRYHEHFVGGGALFFDLQPEIATLNDLNPYWMATYRAIRDDVGAVIMALKPYVDGYADTGAEFFYERRANPPKPADTAMAAWFLFLNRTCFNGLWRVNKSGGFNAPHGKFKSPPVICNPKVLREASAALQCITLTNRDFDSSGISDAGGDFYYFDPPYWPASATSDFTAYTKEPFGPSEQERLRDYALKLKKAGASVLLSNADVEPVRKLYASGFEMRRVEARRAINSNTKKRGKVGELLIW